MLVIPIYFGLAIVVEEARLAATPSCGRLLDHLESAEGRHDLLELAEDLRLEAMSLQHAVSPARRASSTGRPRATSTLLKGALLDEHYLENEVRIDTSSTARARSHADCGRAARPDAPLRKSDCQTLAAARRTGRSRDESGDLLGATSRTRRWAGSASTISSGASTSSAPSSVRRRSRRVRYRTRRRRHLPAGLPRRLRDAAPDGVGGRHVPGRARRSPRREDLTIGDLGCAPTRPQHRPGRLRALRPARRPGPIRAGRARPRPCRRRRSTRSPCSASAAISARAPRALIEQLYDKLTVGGFVVVDDYVEPAMPEGGRRTSATGWASTSSSNASTGPAWVGASSMHP